jgi:hypothetical protein
LLAAKQKVNRGPKGAVIHRHNKIRDALHVREFIKTTCPDARIYKEHNLPPGNNVQLNTDLAVVVGGDMVCVDVVVTNPASVAYIETRCRVPQKPEKLEVAAMAERVKQYKYRATYNQNNHLKHIADNLVPFAVEATGTLGDKASEFVYGLAKLQGAVPEADPRIG